MAVVDVGELLTGGPVDCFYVYPTVSDQPRSIEPTAPFAPGSTLGAIVPQVGFPATTAHTPWVEADGIYTARCSMRGGASVPRIAAAKPGAPELRALPAATWGLHLVDANIALGDLVGLVTHQAQHYVARHPG
ncbi:MAG: hypothetical protein QOK21_3081 [Solirubrobacteraceae bacterium]|nr:hypothetical protein [Solirubrobacteraceae bacterium]